MTKNADWCIIKGTGEADCPAESFQRECGFAETVLIVQASDIPPLYDEIVITLRVGNDAAEIPTLSGYEVNTVGALLH